MYKAAAKKKTFRVGNLTERGNEQYPLSRGEKIILNVKILYLDTKMEHSYTQVKEPIKK